jgi:multidrug efflux pump subunit AcrA (membrane-fusion protein)
VRLLANPFVTSDDDGLQKRIKVGFGVIALVFGVMGMWSVTATLDGAVVATGTVQVEAARKKVQHLEGGIVKEVRVREGDAVAEGDVLIRLDDTAVGANLHLVKGQSAELAIRRYRLLAERDGADEFVLPQAIAIRTNDRGLADIIAGQRTLFDARRVSRLLEIDLLRQQEAQLKAQIEGLQKQEESKTKQIAFYEDELQGLRMMLSKGLTPKGRLLALERDAERGRGEMAALAASIAGAETKLKEIELGIARLTQTFQEKVAEELRTVEAELNTFMERHVGVEDQTQRTEIRAAPRPRPQPHGPHRWRRDQARRDRHGNRAGRRHPGHRRASRAAGRRQGGTECTGYRAAFRLQSAHDAGTDRGGATHFRGPGLRRRQRPDVLSGDHRGPAARGRAAPGAGPGARHAGGGVYPNRRTNASRLSAQTVDRQLRPGLARRLSPSAGKTITPHAIASGTSPVNMRLAKVPDSSRAGGRTGSKRFLCAPQSRRRPHHCLCAPMKGS